MATNEVSVTKLHKFAGNVAKIVNKDGITVFETDPSKFEEAKQCFKTIVEDIRELLNAPEFDGSFAKLRDLTLGAADLPAKEARKLGSLVNGFMLANAECEYQASRLGYPKNEWFKTLWS